MMMMMIEHETSVCVYVSPGGGKWRTHRRGAAESSRQNQFLLWSDSLRGRTSRQRLLHARR